MIVFHVSQLPNLISRKIWVSEKFVILHTVQFHLSMTVSSVLTWLLLSVWRFSTICGRRPPFSNCFYLLLLPTSPKTKLRPPWMMKKLPILWFPHLNSVLLFTDPGQVIPMYHHYPIGLFLGRIQTSCYQRTSFYSVSFFSIWNFMSKWFSDLFISNFSVWNH